MEKFHSDTLFYFQAYAHVTGVFTKGMLAMLNDLKLEHIGRHHSGIGNICELRSYNIKTLLSIMLILLLDIILLAY